MSTANDASPPPDQPSNGPSRSPPQMAPINTSPSPSKWTKDEKTKTCKCEPCGNRVRYWSYKCVECGRHICSECLSIESEKSPWEKAVAKDHVTEGCWCGHRSNMNPAFSGWKPPPPVRTDEEFKARESKGLVMTRRSLKSKRESGRSSDSSLPEHTGESAEKEDDDDYQTWGLTASSPARDATRRRSVKRKVYLETESEFEMHSDTKKHVAKSLKKSKSVISSKETARTTSSNPKQTSLFIDRAPSRPSQPAVKLPDRTQLLGKSTIVVGAGIIGLFLARELAIVASKANIEHRITVIDVRGSYCELASGSCSGFLTTSGMPDEWYPIASEATTYWQDLVSSHEFSEQVRFSKTKLSEVVSSGANASSTPSWLLSGSSISLAEELNAVGRLDSKSLAFWLYEQCELLSVNFRFNHFVCGTEVTDNAQLSRVRVQSTNPLDLPSQTVECRNLVLAAGPFTTGIFRHLFVDSQLELDNHVQGSDWFQMALGNITTGDDIGLRIPLAAESEDRLENEIRLVPRISDITITVSGTTSRIINRDLERTKAQTPGHGKTAELKNLAMKYVHPRIGKDYDSGTQILKRGRSELNVGNGGCPVIGDVSASSLGVTSDDEDMGQLPSGIWLCYGFGNYGTMLAPGAARILTSKMFGTSGGLEDYKFAIAEDKKLELVGKGKGKARV